MILDGAYVVVELSPHLFVLERLLIAHVIRVAARFARVRLELVNPALVDFRRVQAEFQVVDLEKLVDGVVQQVAQNVFASVFSACVCFFESFTFNKYYFRKKASRQTTKFTCRATR